MHPLKRLYILAGSVVGAALAGCGARGAEPVPSFAGRPKFRPDAHFAVIGDLQRTMIWGRLVMAEQNDAERRLLVPKLAESRPAFAVLLGDLVADGSSDGHWREFDDRTALIRESNIPVFAVPGNHEYMFGGIRNLRHYFTRLPHLNHQHWYGVTFGNLGLVMLDSNFGPLSDVQWNEQRRWFETILKRFDEERSVEGVLVFLHHAPFTNSTTVKDDVHVQEAFVRPFAASKKTLAMLTGHAHGYEHFVSEGKTFIVTGGGGGPRFPLLQGAERRHVDDKYDGPPVRPFNFVELGFRDGGLHADVIGLPKGCRSFCIIESFDLLWLQGERASRERASWRLDLPQCAHGESEVPCETASP